MNPCQLNVIVTAITNHLYANLTKDQFFCLNIFLSELSKSMFSMSLFRDVCDKGGLQHPPCRQEPHQPKKSQ